MVEWKIQAPIKILIEDIKYFEKFKDIWIYKPNDGIQTKNVNKIVIQGEIIKTAGFSNEILIVDDRTGKAKVTRGPQAPGNLSWVNSGQYCSVVGTLIENGKLPLIQADKIAKITNKVLLEMWPWEVKELKDVMVNKCFPKLLEDGDIIAHDF